MVKIGLIGLGQMGLTHLRILSFLKNVKINFIYDIDLNKMNKFSKLYNCKYSCDLDKDFKDIDALIIASPTESHFQYLMKSLGIFKNIFVEKPLSNKINESKKIFRLVKKFRTNFMIGMIERFNPVFDIIKKILKENGKPMVCHFSRCGNLSDRIKDTDVINDLMIHDIDLALNFNGNIKSIQSHAIKKKNLIQYVHAKFMHNNGTLSILESSRITQKKIRKINLLFKEKYVDVDLINKDIIVSTKLKFNKHIKGNIKNIKRNYDFYFRTNEYKIETTPQEPALVQMSSFINSCETNIKRYLYLETILTTQKLRKSIIFF